jgi:hypothetical protein
LVNVNVSTSNLLDQDQAGWLVISSSHPLFGSSSGRARKNASSPPSSTTQLRHMPSSGRWWQALEGWLCIAGARLSFVSRSSPWLMSSVEFDHAAGYASAGNGVVSPSLSRHLPGQNPHLLGHVTVMHTCTFTATGTIQPSAAPNLHTVLHVRCPPPRPPGCRIGSRGRWRGSWRWGRSPP